MTYVMAALVLLIGLGLMATPLVSAADLPVDPATVGAPIAGAGLLAAFLWWFARTYLPQKDAQTEKLVGAHHTYVRELIEMHRGDLMATRAEFKDTLNGVIQHCDREMQLIIETLRAPRPRE